MSASVRDHRILQRLSFIELCLKKAHVKAYSLPDETRGLINGSLMILSLIKDHLELEDEEPGQSKIKWRRHGRGNQKSV